MQDLFSFLTENVIQLLKTDAPKHEIPRTVEESAIALQKKMEAFVDGHADIRTLARKAYQSFVRAYTTYPTALRHIFNLKNLHLGHVAKSFCLAEAPTKIGAVIGVQAQNKKWKKRSALFDEVKAPAKRARLQKMRNKSEFDAGLDGVSAQALPKKFQIGNTKSIKNITKSSFK